MRRVLLRVLLCAWFVALAPLGWMASTSYERLATVVKPTTTTEPGPTTTEPDPTTTEPDTTTTDPAPTTTEPDPTTTEPAPTTTEPGPTTTEPGTTDPGTTTDPSTTAPTTTTPGTTTAPSTTGVLGTTTTRGPEPSPPAPPQPTTVASPSPPPGKTAPPNVSNLLARPGDRSIKLTYQIPADIDHVIITRSAGQAAGQIVYRGTAATYTDRGLTNGVEYKYVIASVDKEGTASGGLAILVVPRKNLLRAPKNGARLKKVPKVFTWRRDPRATYYNFQLYSGGTLLFQSAAVAESKILSAFPTKPLYRLKNPWKWKGRKYKMVNGAYTWYVWPGYGARSAVRYGPLMGAATFQIRR